VLSDEIITKLDLIKQSARKRYGSDLRFREWVKRQDMDDNVLDGLVADTANEVEGRIDCTTCANCCRTMQIVVDDQDIGRLAKSLFLPAAELERRYVRRAKDGVKHFAGTPCPFLEGNRCSVYEDRPEACRDFPYLHSRGSRQRMLVMIDNAGECPIVFNTLARLKGRLGFRDRK
jgi:uncharacterized protein